MSDKKLLKFKYVKVKNFLSYKEAHLSLDDKGLVAVSGYNKANKKSNGSGKSALIAESIVFALFGEPIRKLSVTKIPNRFSKGQCSVEIEFEVQGHTYRVTRCRRPDTLKLEIDGVSEESTDDNDKSLGDSRDTNKKIREIIGMGFDEFINSILFGQNIQKYFFLLNDSKQKDMIDNIIDIGIFESWKATAKDLLNQFENLKQQKVSAIANVESQITSCTNRIADINRKEAEFLAARDTNYDHDIQTTIETINNINAQITELENQIQPIDAEKKKSLKEQELKLVDGIGKLTTLISKASQAISKQSQLPLKDGVLVLQQPANSTTLQELETLKNSLVYEQASCNTQVQNDTALLQTHGSKVKSVESLLNSDCPTCGRKVDDSCLESIKKAYVDIISSIKAKIVDLQTTMQSIAVQLTSVNGAITDRRNQELFTEVMAAQQDVLKYSNMKEVLNTQLGVVQTALTDIDKKEKFNSEVRSNIAYQKSQKISQEARQADLVAKKSTTVAENPFKELREKEQTSIVSLTADIEKYQKEIDSVTQYIDACTYWVKAFGDKNGVKSYIYEKVFPYLNERCNHYLGLLSNGEIQAEIGLDDKDRFIVKTENAVGADVYGGNSGGEKRRIDLAVMFALHDLVASRKYHSNILILDEIFDNLDINGIDTAMSVLEDISPNYDSIFVISHTDMQEYFDNHLYILKDGNTSYVTTTLEAA